MQKANCSQWKQSHKNVLNSTKQMVILAHIRTDGSSGGGAGHQWHEPVCSKTANNGACTKVWTRKSQWPGLFGCAGSNVKLCACAGLLGSLHRQIIGGKNGGRGKMRLVNMIQMRRPHADRAWMCTTECWAVTHATDYSVSRWCLLHLHFQWTHFSCATRVAGE